MKKYFQFILLLSISSMLQAQPQHKFVLPNEAKPFILKGYTALDYIKGDINRDGKPDAILILKNNLEDEDNDTAAFDLLRPILLLVRNSSNQLELKLRNDSFVLCKKCGGMMGDPYEFTDITKDTINIYFYGGSRWRWSESYFFLFNKPTQQWEMVKHIKDYYDNTQPNKETPACIIPKEELKGITLASANLVGVGIETKWKVVSPKAYFYTSPNRNTKPRKAYLLKGEEVEGYHETVNFVFVEYYSKTGKTTRGCILKKDLLPIEHTGN